VEFDNSENIYLFSVPAKVAKKKLKEML